MLVKEAISFERHKDPKRALGLDDEAARQYTFEKLQEEGANFDFWGIDVERNQQKKTFLENIFEIERTLEKCKGIFTIKEISAMDGKISYKPGDLYNIIYAGHTMFTCASKNDAEFVVSVLSNIIVDTYKKTRFKIELEKSSISYPHLRSYDVVEIVDDIIETRKKFNINVS